MDSIILYHGSRGGIVGDIKPESRLRCDFGKGFYMGVNANQAKTLVANDPSPYFYELKLHLEKIPDSKIIHIKDMNWAYYVLYNRGKLDVIKGSKLYKKCKYLAEGRDVIVGAIADDAMNESMKRFIDGTITDVAFLESIRAIKYGNQYVAKSDFACSCIKVISERELSGQELDSALKLSEQLRKDGARIAREVQKKYRRVGKYFDEIINEIQKDMSKGAER